MLSTVSNLLVLLKDLCSKQSDLSTLFACILKLVIAISIYMEQIISVLGYCY